MPATATATIRVSRSTRDALAECARRRGVTLAGLLSEMAREMEVEAAYESERRASELDASNPEALAEIELWESTLEDGID